MEMLSVAAGPKKIDSRQRLLFHNALIIFQYATFTVVRCITTKAKLLSQITSRQTCHHADHARLVDILQTSKFSCCQDGLQVTISAGLLHGPYLIIQS